MLTWTGAAAVHRPLMVVVVFRFSFVTGPTNVRMYLMHEVY
jgi:hypothetical protein